MGVTNTNSIAYKLVANDEILDLFDDEDILLSDNITGLFDIGTLPVDFSRTVILPATKKNNAFFEHVYDISIDEPYLFSTNTKVNAYLDFDGIYLVSGYIQLNKVNLKGDLGILSYEVSLYGLVSSFARDMDKNYLTDLTTLNQYNHTSSYNAITSSWSGSLFNGDIVYPLADYGSGYQFAAGTLQTFGINDIDGALTVQNFKPAIRLKRVWDACFEEYGYTYTGSFWEQPFLDDVYMFCNTALKYPEYSGVDLETFGKIKVGAISGSGMTDVNMPANTFVTLPWYNELSDPQNVYNDGAYTLTKESNLEGILNLNLNISCSVNNIPGTFSANGTFQLQMIETGSSTAYGLTALQSYIVFFDQLQNSREGKIDTTYELKTQFKLSDIPVGTYYFQIKQRPNVSTGTLPTVTIDPGNTTKSFLEIKQVNNAADGLVIDIPTNMPYGTNGIKLIDFIKGIQKKFNLIIYPNKTNPNQMIVDSFNSWYDKGKIKNFNKYINLNENIEVIPANNLAVNQLEFGDTLDQDYISQQFSKAANRPFGQTFYNDTQNFFSQGKLEIKTTFASSPLLQIAGTGLSGSVAGANPTPTNTYFNYVSSTGYQSRSDEACNHTGGYYTVYSAEEGIDNITKLYTDYGLTTPYNGGYQYHRFIDISTYEAYSVFVSYDGSIFGYQLCGFQP